MSGSPAALEPLVRRLRAAGCVFAEEEAALILDQAAAAGGGVVQAYPQDTDGKKITASFLYNGTRSLFEQAGFTYLRPKGKQHCVMSTTVEAAAVSRP